MFIPIIYLDELEAVGIESGCTSEQRRSGLRKTSYWSDTLPCLIAACTLFTRIEGVNKGADPLEPDPHLLLVPDDPRWLPYPANPARCAHLDDRAVLDRRVPAQGGDDHPEGHVVTRGDVSISWERYWTVGKTSPGSFAGNVSTVSPHRISGIPPTSESLRRIEGSVWTSRIG